MSPRLHHPASGASGRGATSFLLRFKHAAPIPCAVRMNALPLLLVAPLLLLGLSPTAAAAPCAPPTTSDDGVHTVGQAGTVVTVNLVGADLTCTFLVVRVHESWSEDLAALTCILNVSDDLFHSVTEFGGTVTVNDADVFLACAAFAAHHPEVWTLP